MQNSNLILKFLLSLEPKTVDKYLSKIPISKVTTFYYYVVTYKLIILHYCLVISSKLLVRVQVKSSQFTQSVKSGQITQVSKSSPSQVNNMTQVNLSPSLLTRVNKSAMIYCVALFANRTIE